MHGHRIACLIAKQGFGQEEEEAGVGAGRGGGGGGGGGAVPFTLQYHVVTLPPHSSHLQQNQIQIKFKSNDNQMKIKFFKNGVLLLLLLLLLLPFNTQIPINRNKISNN